MISPPFDRARRLYLPPWRIDLVRRAGTQRLLGDRALARTVAGALEVARAPRPSSVTVVLTDDVELAELNAEHMGHEGGTDVLSFPMLAPEAFPARTAGAAPGVARFTPVGQPANTVRRLRIHIGDIAISVERAIEQAAAGRGGQTGDVRWSAADELRLLVTHGTLHLCGWDHATPAEEAEMRALEQGLLDRPD